MGGTLCEWAWWRRRLIYKTLTRHVPLDFRIFHWNNALAASPTTCLKFLAWGCCRVATNWASHGLTDSPLMYFPVWPKSSSHLTCKGQVSANSHAIACCPMQCILLGSAPFSIGIILYTSVSRWALWGRSRRQRRYTRKVCTVPVCRTSTYSTQVYIM
jgi:hypothetical protein